MNIQIFGIKKCFDTKKAERFFKERNIKFQFIDLKEKEMSKGEFENVLKSVGIKNLINEKCGNYKKLNFDNIRSSEVKAELLLKNQSVIKTPVVRNGKKATAGYEPATWEEWIKEDKLN